MAISIKIHSTDTSDGVCVATIKDGNNIVVDNANIGLQLNLDGTANTEWIEEKARHKVLTYRKKTTANSIIIINSGEG
tara:strand:+ start:5352 stop:5585 length:234 start_codon:yes stop_codon:yes gene_type:complete